MRRLAPFTRLVVCLLVLAALAGPGRAASPVRVAVYTPTGDETRNFRTLQRVLSPSEGFRTSPISPAAIRRGDLRDYDVLIMPGGTARHQTRLLGPQGCEAIRQYVHAGGGYVGICAGSYLATAYYPWSLGLLNARVVDRQHWARGTGKVWLQLSPTGQSVLHDRADRVQVYYGQGPLLAPGHYRGLPPYEDLARYATAIATRRGARPESMIGTTAIARGPFGRGRVICFSPHPEGARGPNHFIRAGVRWVANRPLPSPPVLQEREVDGQGAARCKGEIPLTLALAPGVPGARETNRLPARAEAITPAGERLVRALDGMDVEHHWLPGLRVHWRSGEPTQPHRRAATHCSAFVAAACDRLGVYILRPPEHSQTLLANAQQRWLLGQGRTQGWREIRTWSEAQRLANQGAVVVASYRNPNPHKPGHVALVRPSNKSAQQLAIEGPEVIWAGRHNRNQGSLREGFRKHPVEAIRFFAHAYGNTSRGR